jgi:alpha-tubulin suppressor-like RCC1 family protein
VCVCAYAWMCVVNISVRWRRRPTLGMSNVVAWGYGEDGQLAIDDALRSNADMSASQSDTRDLILGDRAMYIASPAPIVSFPPRVVIVSVSAGSRHSLAVDRDGVLYSWGWGMVSARLAYGRRAVALRWHSRRNRQ